MSTSSTVGVRWLVVAGGLVTACASKPVPPARTAVDPAPASVVVAGNGDARISGIAIHSRTEEPLSGVLIVLECGCLAEALELQTDSRGQYRFGELPPGAYSVRLLVGAVEAIEPVALTAEGDAWAAFSVDPKNEIYCLERSQPRTSFCPF